MATKKIKIVVERAEDGTFSAYADNVAKIYGMGDTIDDVKKSVISCIEILKGFEDCPAALKKSFDLVYKFDTRSFLNYYSGIFTYAALERITGINQKQIQHYATGIKKPRNEQSQKIEKALHGLGSELLAIEL